MWPPLYLVSSEACRPLGISPSPRKTWTYYIDSGKYLTLPILDLMTCKKPKPRPGKLRLNWHWKEYGHEPWRCKKAMSFGSPFLLFTNNYNFLISMLMPAIL